MSTTSRTVQATPGVGPLVAIFAAALAGTALIVALAYGQLTASSSTSVTPAAGAAPVVVDHGWSSSSIVTTPAVPDHGWSSASHPRPNIRGRAFDRSHHAVPRVDRLERSSGSGSRIVRLPR